MTAEDFLTFYPAFGDPIPRAVLDFYVEAANLRFTNLEDGAEEARMLYIAHKLTLYAKETPPTAGEEAAKISLSALASAGDGRAVTSKKVENVAVSYAAPAASGSTTLRELEETLYGRQLLSLLRLNAPPVYIPG